MAEQGRGAALRASWRRWKSAREWLLILLLALGLILADRYRLLDLDTLLNAHYRVHFTRPHSGSLDPVPALVEGIDQAVERVWVASFDFDLPAVAEALLRARDRGVDVRLIVDEDNLGLPEIRALDRARLPLRADTRDALMHNKFVVIDDLELWVGSLNLTANGVGRNNNNMIQWFSEELNHNFAVEFEELWAGRFGPTSPADTPFPIVRLADMTIESYFSPEDNPRTALALLLDDARFEIRFLAFSFTDDLLAERLRRAHREGVEVAGLFEAFGASGEFSQYRSLQRAGIALRTDGNPGIMHHKVMIIDERYVVTGSYNFTQAAARSNDESLLIVDSPSIAEFYLEEWWRLWEEAE